MLNKRLHGQPGAESSGFSLEHQEQKRRDWLEEWASSASLARITSCVSPEAHFQANLLQNLKHSNGWQRVGQDLVTKQQQMGQKRSLSKLKNKWQIVRKHLQHVKKKKKKKKKNKKKKMKDYKKKFLKFKKKKKATVPHLKKSTITWKNRQRKWTGDL